MRLHHAFRPTVQDSLEDRVVPSQAGASSPVQVLLTQTIPLPSAIRADGGVQRAFDAFVTRYTADVASVLLAPGADGTINIAANLPAFRSALATDLQLLSRDLTAALSQSTDTAALIPTVQDAITGDGLESLQSQLNVIAASFGTQGTSLPVFAASSAQAIQEAAGQVAAQTLAPGRSRIIQGDPTDAFPVANDLHVSLVSLATPRLKQAFDAFLRQYTSSLNALLASPPANVQTGHAAFRAEVSSALSQLDAHVAQVLRDLRASAPQAARVHEALVGPGAQSLKTVLSTVPTPAQGAPPSTAVLQILSSKLIANAMSQVTDIVSALVPGLN